MSPPDEQERRNTASPKDKPETASQRRERERHEKYLAAINALTDQLATNQEHDDAGEKDHSLREKVTIGLVFLTLIATGVGDAIFYFTMRDAREAAVKAHADNVAALEAGRIASKNALIGAHIDSDNALRAANDSSAIQQKQTKSALVAAGRSADAATAQAQIAREGLITENRAWIAPANAKLQGLPLSASTRLVLRIDFANSGHGPAFDFADSLRPAWFSAPHWNTQEITHWGALDIWNRPELRFDHLCSGVHARQGAMVVFPNAASAIYSPPLTDVDAIRGVKVGTTVFSVVGCAAYLTQGRERRVSFCFYVEPVYGVKPDEWEVKTCPAGNYAD